MNVKPVFSIATDMDHNQNYIRDSEFQLVYHYPGTVLCMVDLPSEWCFKEDYMGQFAAMLVKYSEAGTAFEFLNYHFQYAEDTGKQDNYLACLRFNILPLLNDHKKHPAINFLEAWMHGQPQRKSTDILTYREEAIKVTYLMKAKVIDKYNFNWKKYATEQGVKKPDQFYKKGWNTVFANTGKNYRPPTEIELKNVKANLLEFPDIQKAIENDIFQVNSLSDS
jgi:hypothetical protein